MKSSDGNSKPRRKRRMMSRANPSSSKASPNNPSVPMGRQRLFSARVFSASQSRSPFAADDSERPSTSSHRRHPLASEGRLNSSNKDAYHASDEAIDERTDDELSNIDDIELDELDLKGHRVSSRTSHGQEMDRAEKILADQPISKEHIQSKARQMLSQSFSQRRRRMESSPSWQAIQDDLSHKEDALMEAGGLKPSDGEETRAFSPALDVELVPTVQAERSQPGQLVAIRRMSSSAPTKPTRQDEELIVSKKSSSAQNGSVGGSKASQQMVIVPTPEITVSSPREQKQPRQQGITAASTQAHMNPSLIKGLSKSISRFRGRNRVMDAEALEQANFMSKFGMSGTGIQPAARDEQAAHNGDKSAAGQQSCFGNLVFDTNENYFYQWVALVSTAYVYNLLVVIARTVFIDLAAGRPWILWLTMDLLMDSIFVADMFVRSRTGYLEQGLLVRDCAKIRMLYIRSRQFLWDCASILPFDYFCFLIFSHQQPILRMNRLLRKERIQKFMEQTETRTSMPNAFRVGVVVWYIAVIIHWNACFYFLISESIGLGSDPWVYGVMNKQSLPEGINDTLTRRYIYSFYWSTLILTTIGEVPGPQQNVEYAFVTVDLMCGVLIFATIVGNVGSMISNISASRTDFQNRIDSIKQYMDLRGVGKQLEVRVIKWFDYLWANKQGLTDAQVLKVLPDKLQAEIAMHVHFETLRKVRIFQDCEAGLLAELVLKLQLQVFSPGDYVCRKGDIGREMYIVKRGMLQVVADDGLKIFATLSEGAVFGELSILNIAGSKNGNRRTANVRSVGYTDLFVLNKNDLWIALREYPEARKILINKGRELLRKDNLLDENAPEEQKTAEELSEELQSGVRILQIRIARLIAEHTNTDTKLRERIAYLEGKMRKYAALTGAADDYR